MCCDQDFELAFCVRVCTLSFIIKVLEKWLKNADFVITDRFVANLFNAINPESHSFDLAVPKADLGRTHVLRFFKNISSTASTSFRLTQLAKCVDYDEMRRIKRK